MIQRVLLSDVGLWLQVAMPPARVEPPRARALADVRFLGASAFPAPGGRGASLGAAFAF